MCEVDLIPAQRAKLGGAQAVPEGKQDHGRIAMTVPVVACGLDQALDFGLGQIFAATVSGIAKSTT